MINNQQGLKPAYTTRVLGRHHSTITRELSHQFKGHTSLQKRHTAPAKESIKPQTTQAFEL